MKLLSKIFLAFGLLALVPNLAHAQGVTRICQETVNSVTGANNCVDVSAANPFNVNASVSVGGFAPGGSYISPLSVTNSSSNAALPTGTEVVVYNVGANAVYVKLGTSNAVTATTSDDYISAGGALALTVGSNTYIAAITAASTSTLNVSGGAGLPTGWGGGGGSGGGGTVTQGAAASSGPWIFTPWIAGAVNSATNGLYFDLLQGNAVLSATNPIFVSPATAATWAATESGTWNITNITGTVSLPTGAATAANQSAGTAGTPSTVVGSVQGVSGGVAVSVAQGTAASSGPWIFTPWIAGAVNSATNGLYGNLLQGNAVISATNGLYSNLLQGNAALSATNGLYANFLQGNAALSLTNPLFAASPISPTITNPTSTLTLTSATTAYAIGNLIASSPTAGSVVVPSFTIATSGGAAVINKLLLTSNDSTSTAWGSAQIQIDLWTTAPTFTNGDRAAFVVATGTAGHRAAFTCTMSPEYGDGVYAECTPNYGSEAVKLASGTTVYWTLQALTISGVTGASKALTLTVELLN